MITLQQKLQQFIADEMNDCLLYEELATIAPNDNYRQLLMAMSNDEEDHASEFKRIYQKMYGTTFAPVLNKPLFKSTFDEIVAMRVLDETSDFRKYGYQYFQSESNSELKNAYYVAQVDETVHALRLLYMLHR